jgi:hypothetical protein
MKRSTVRCSDCRREIVQGLWPFCPHDPLRDKRARHDRKAVYYRDADGNVCIPPTPDSIPKGCKPIVIKSIYEADKISAEVAADYRAKFAHDSFTAETDANLGEPRKRLIDRMAETHSNLERDTIRVMIADLDREADKRGSMEVNARFHWRDHDGR